MFKVPFQLMVTAPGRRSSGGLTLTSIIVEGRGSGSSSLSLIIRRSVSAMISKAIALAFRTGGWRLRLALVEIKGVWRSFAKSLISGCGDQRMAILPSPPVMAAGSVFRPGKIMVRAPGQYFSAVSRAFSGQWLISLSKLCKSPTTVGKGFSGGRFLMLEMCLPSFSLRALPPIA